MRKAPNGDLYFTAASNLARIVAGGSPEVAVAFPLRLEGTVTANVPGTVWDVNNAGGIAMFSSTSAGDSRIVYWQNGTAKSLLNASATAATASTVDGKIVQNVQALAVDDNGRVIAQVQFRNVTPTSLVVWDGSAWTVAATVNVTRISNRTVTGLPTMPRANGQRLYAAMTVQTGGNVVAEWTGGAWQVVVDVDTIMPNGQNANSVPAVELNAQGDLLFQYSNGVNSLVARRGGKFRQVHNFFRPTDDGDWLIRINSMDFRDDGTVYFLAVTEEDEVVLYEARPVN
jgi:flagellar hook protein FlgE